MRKETSTHQLSESGLDCTQCFPNRQGGTSAGEHQQRMSYDRNWGCPLGCWEEMGRLFWGLTHSWRGNADCLHTPCIIIMRKAHSISVRHHDMTASPSWSNTAQHCHSLFSRTWNSSDGWLLPAAVLYIRLNTEGKDSGAAAVGRNSAEATGWLSILTLAMGCKHVLQSSSSCAVPQHCRTAWQWAWVQHFTLATSRPWHHWPQQQNNRQMPGEGEGIF